MKAEIVVIFKIIKLYMEESTQSSTFLVFWHQAMLYGSVLMFIAAIATYVIHHIRIASLKDFKQKYDYINRREIRNYELIFIFIAIGVAMLINRYGMDKVEKVEVWFFVRIFISVAGGILVGYVAYLVLEYYYTGPVHRKLMKWRYMPRVNPRNGNKMRLLAEHEEDVHLDPGMKAEEDVFSIDYDVWFDEESGEVIIEKYPGHLEALKCNNCSFYTMKIVREEITQEATTESPGELIKHYVCSYCKSIRATAFKISTMEAEDYKHEKHVFQKNKDVVLVKVEIRSSAGGSKFYEFGDVEQAQRFMAEIGDKK
jgi:hypothetical protein